MKFILFILVLVIGWARSPFAYADEVAVDANKITHGLVAMDRKFLYLFDRKNHNRHAVKVTKPDDLIPHRVYMKYDDGLHNWIYVKTDFGGKLPKPTEALRPGTVTFGKVIGADIDLQRFILLKSGTWVATVEKEKYRVQVQSKPPRNEVFTFQKIPESDEKRLPAYLKPSPPPSNSKQP